jgi:hypothetical protein
MAKQCGPLFFECTWDLLTFYLMDGKYYVRRKSRLTREKVLTHPAFHKTRVQANLLATASKIASSIYSDLPVNWRQFWMFRSFTGEAKTMMKEGLNAQEAYDLLWKTYVEYWVIYQHTTGIPLKTGRTFKKVKPKSYKTRLRHRGGEDKYSRRYYKLLGKNHWKSSYDHTADLLALEEKRQRKALNAAAYQRLLDKEKSIAEEQAALAAMQDAALVAVTTIITDNSPPILPEPDVRDAPVVPRTGVNEWNYFEVAEGVSG